jgi:hypothetical protein
MMKLESELLQEQEEEGGDRRNQPAHNVRIEKDELPRRKVAEGNLASPDLPGVRRRGPPQKAPHRVQLILALEAAWERKRSHGDCWEWIAKEQGREGSRAQGSRSRKGMRRRRGAAASVVGKSEKVAVPFGAYLLCKSCCLLAFHDDRGEVERLPPPAPPLLTLYDRWARAHQSSAWVQEDQGGGGEKKGGDRTARAARRARIRQEPEPSGAHGARGGRAPRGSRYGRKDIHALPRRERVVHPARCWDLAPPAGSSLSRGGPGGLCRYIRTAVPPARVSRPLAFHNPKSPPCPQVGGQVRYTECNGEYRK